MFLFVYHRALPLRADLPPASPAHCPPAPSSSFIAGQDGPSAARAPEHASRTRKLLHGAYCSWYHQPAPLGAIAVRWLAACPGRRTRSLTGGSTQPALSNRGHCSEHLHSSHADNGIISSFIMQFCIAMSAPPNQSALLPLRRAADHPTIFRMSGDVNFWMLGCVGRGITSREPIAARKLSWALHTRPATFAR